MPWRWQRGHRHFGQIRVDPASLRAFDDRAHSHQNVGPMKYDANLRRTLPKQRQTSGQADKRTNEQADKRPTVGIGQHWATLFTEFSANVEC